MQPSTAGHVEIENHKQQAKRFYFSVFFKHFWIYALGIVAVCVTNFTEVVIPRLLQWAVDLLINDPDHTIPDFLTADSELVSLKRIATIFLVCMLVGWATRMIWRQCLARRTHYSGRMLRLKLWDVFRFMPLKTFQKFPLGDLLNRSISDVNNSRFILGFTLVMISDLIFFTVLSVAMMFLIDWELALYCIVVFPIIPFFIVPITKKEYENHTWAQEKLSSISELISQALVTVKLQRSTALEEVWRKKLYSEAGDYTERKYQVIKTAWSIFPYGAAPTFIAYGILLLFGTQKIQQGDLSIGEFVALLSYVQLLEGPLFEIGDAISEWQKGISSLGRIVEVFGVKPDFDAVDTHQAVERDEALNAVRLDAVCFRYTNQDRSILNETHLVVKKGEWVGVTGVIGTGKSTLLALVAGIESEYDGKIEIFGTDIRFMDRKQLTDLMGFVPQRPFLFGGTVRHNLNLDETFSSDELWRVLDLVKLADDFREREFGLDTWIGEWGINLSGGQKQRLTLARALLRPRPILVIDDCLSAVDAITEEMILKNIRDEISDLTLIWVAHRVSTLKLCEKIYTLSDGALTPFGISPKEGR